MKLFNESSTEDVFRTICVLWETTKVWGWKRYKSCNQEKLGFGVDVMQDSPVNF